MAASRTGINQRVKAAWRIWRTAGKRNNSAASLANKKRTSPRRACASVCLEHMVRRPAGGLRPSGDGWLCRCSLRAQRQRMPRAPLAEEMSMKAAHMAQCAISGENKRTGQAAWRLGSYLSA